MLPSQSIDHRGSAQKLLDLLPIVRFSFHPKLESQFNSTRNPLS
jgi:hypothetical protein